MRLLAVDPGTRALGWAWFDGPRTRFRGGGVIQAKNLVEMFDRIRDTLTFDIFDMLAVERPQVYRHMKGDPDDMTGVAIVTGAVVGYVRWKGLWLPRPSQWKGQVPKDVCAARAANELDDGEQEVLARTVETIPSGKRRYDFYDAMALGVKTRSRRSTG